jgi:DivIVA domain-containing protein
MKVTALETRQPQFPLRLRGYDPTAVDIFLDNGGKNTPDTRCYMFKNGKVRGCGSAPYSIQLSNKTPTPIPCSSAPTHRARG